MTKHWKLYCRGQFSIDKGCIWLCERTFSSLLPSTITLFTLYFLHMISILFLNGKNRELQKSYLVSFQLLSYFPIISLILYLSNYFFRYHIKKIYPELFFHIEIFLCAWNLSNIDVIDEQYMLFIFIFWQPYFLSDSDAYQKYLLLYVFFCLFLCLIWEICMNLKVNCFKTTC